MLAISSKGKNGAPDLDMGEMLKSGDWVAERKEDGIRAWMAPFGDGRIYSRTGHDLTYKFPEVTNPSSEWADVEIVATSRIFEDALFRESQTSVRQIEKAASDVPCIAVGFDLPERSGPWTERREHLNDTGLSVVHYFVDYQTTDFAKGQGYEGVVLKRRSAVYQPGKRSADWVKFKFTERYSCIAFGYSRGNGSRAHFGAIQLALLDADDTPIPVGRVGTGFTERQIGILKERLDRGEPFVIDVECLKFTSGRQLRQPVFRGVRNDVELSACTFDQH